MNRNTIAINVLTRWVPDTCEDARCAVGEAQRTIAEALRAGNTRIGSWLVERYEAAVAAEHEGIVKQLSPLVPYLIAPVQRDAELAAKVIGLARRLGDERLYVAACRSARLALAASGEPSPLVPKAATTKGRAGR